MPPIRILTLAANPKISGYDPLRLDAEVRRIEEALQRSPHRDRFQMATKLAVRTSDLRRALLEHRPQILHFSGHGTQTQGLVLENDAGQAQLVSIEALTRLFAALDSNPIDCVLLNACYSEMQAKAIHPFVDCVIGMNQPIGDQAAIQFAEGFYDALGAGSTYAEAFKIGCNAIELEGSPEYTIPILLGGKGGRAVAPVARGAQASTVTVAEEKALPPNQTQSIGNVTISGSNNPFNAVQAAGDVNIAQTHIHDKITNPDLQAALEALGHLKQAIAKTDAIDETAKAMVTIPIQKLEAELQKPQPDRSLVNRMVAIVKKALDGVLTLAEPVTKVATLIAKAWANLL